MVWVVHDESSLAGGMGGMMRELSGRGYGWSMMRALWPGVWVVHDESSLAGGMGGP